MNTKDWTTYQLKISNHEIELKDLPMEIISQLLKIAIQKIDEYENLKLNNLGFDQEDERDIFDYNFDLDCILEDLFNIAKERVEYEEMD